MSDDDTKRLPRPSYVCKVCGAPVEMRAGEAPLRTCGHAEAAILANMSATMRGRGGAMLPRAPHL